MAEENFLKDDNNIQLETTSEYQNVANTNLQFYNMDTGTAVLNFIVTKNGRPFELGPSNIKATIALKTANYDVENGVYISDDLVFKDPINGRLSYTLPDAILNYNGTVYGQAYFAQNGNGNTIVERKFSFTVANDLISDFPAETKLTHIKTLNDITENIQDDVALIKRSLSGAETIVQGINETVDDGVSQLEVKTNKSIEMITTTETEKNAVFNEKLNSAITQLDEKKEAISTDVANLQSQVNNANLLISTEAENWQKHAFTDVNGMFPEIIGGSIENTIRDATSSKIVHMLEATDAPSFKINEPILNPDEVTEEIDPEEEIDPNIDTGIEDDPTVDGVFNEVTEEVEVPDTTVSETPTTGGSGLLKIYLAGDVGRATWEPDDVNEIYTRFYKQGVWYGWGKINDEEVSKQFITDQVATSESRANAYTDTKISELGGQKYTMTNADGTLIQTNLDYGLQKLYALKTGNYYALNVPDLPGNVKSTNGYLTVLYKDVTSAFISFIPEGDTKRYVKQLSNSVWGTFFTPDAVANVVLFEGNASGLGTTINLADSYRNYSTIKVYATGFGGNDVKEFSGATSTDMAVYTFNITDADGSDGHISETKLTRTSERVLTITNEVTYRFKTLTGQPVTNGIVITKIVGVK